MLPRHIAVIGAGWAGCAAAVELSRRGVRVTVFEAARQAGGRARRIEHLGQSLDNGQHILLGAYRDTLHLMQVVGLNPSGLLLRLPLQMCYPEGSKAMSLVAPRVAAPFHLALAMLRARGLKLSDRWALLRLSLQARLMGWTLEQDCTVADLLQRFQQTPRVIQLLWRPLCLAALNTPPERASAQVFLNVLRDSLGASRHASDMLLPKVDLSALFPNAALNYVEQLGGRVFSGCPVRSLAQVEGQWVVCSDEANHRFDQVILAAAPAQAEHLLSASDLAPNPAWSFEYEAITTCYLSYAPTLSLAAPFLALADDAERAHWGQFVFDRGQLDSSQAGMLAVIVSASGSALERGKEALMQGITAQLAQAFQRPELAFPNRCHVITEKRASFACTPALRRPKNRTPHAGMWLAGDYTEGPYPATLEGAVRSGLAVAQTILSE